MSKPPRMSGRALRHLHRRSLVLGALLLLFLLLIYVVVIAISASSENGSLLGALITALLFTSTPLVVAVVLFLVGLLGERTARRINREDWACAVAVAQRCEELLATPAETAYESDAVQQLDPRRVLEVERHFDERTSGEARGTIMHQFSMFGRSVGLGYAAGNRTAVTTSAFSGVMHGLSDVHLTISSVARHDLMGDALFALFETTRADGTADTLRVTALSNGAVHEWVLGLVQQTALTFGMDTHTGATMSAYAQRLASHVAPTDVSYLSDQLHLAVAQEKRGEAGTAIAVRGVPSGRGAIVATGARIGREIELRIFPTAFPAMWGDAVGRAIAEAAPRREIAS